MKKKTKKIDYIIALAGNPNVGKSTVFNNLTGLRQHTGNWPGKTVSNASGNYIFDNENYLIYDLPGTYSLNAHSTEEEVARDFICFGNYDVAVIVCDAVCLERNLNLVLQVLEITNKSIICVNLLDEAKKKKIKIDLVKLSDYLGVPVVGSSASKGKGMKELVKKISLMVKVKTNSYLKIDYNETIEKAIKTVESNINNVNLNKRWLALKLLDDDYELINSLNHSLGYNIIDNELEEVINKAKQILLENDITSNNLKEYVISAINKKAEFIYHQTVTLDSINYNQKDLKIDKWLTSKWTGIPFMLALLATIFWITIVGANYPSSWLFDFLFSIDKYLKQFLEFINSPTWLIGMLVDGVYRVLAWVISVMLPPMLIFFPLFTLLEDAGILPRIAFNLDKYFKKCYTCGKQALTMAMGFGCNAVGVTGCRIIDSPRERLIAMITNAFVPCNGRYPTLISIITMFLIGGSLGGFTSVISTLLLVGVILIGIFMTFLISKILSKTILKGYPSSFTLELPPYRKPQFGKVIIRSILDRSLFVLGRAVIVAAPAGLVIWLLANIDINNISLLNHCANALEPFANLFGLDGVILMAFILGFPANEIVFPIIIMTYMATGQIIELDNLEALKTLLIDNGWTITTAICVMLFSLMHWPCSTTCLTIKKESKSWKWTLISILIPTITGLIVCFIVSHILNIFL